MRRFRGVELADALIELAQPILRREIRRSDPQPASVQLVKRVRACCIHQHHAHIVFGNNMPDDDAQETG